MVQKTFACIFCLKVVAAVILAGVSHIGGAAADVAFEKYMEPEVHRYTNVFPKEVCEKIIELGEAAGFPLEPDSIDSYGSSETNNSSQAIDVVDEDGTVNYPEIFGQFEPYLPTIQKLIVNQRNAELHKIIFPDEPTDRLPKLNWVFFRKYSPNSPRNSLIPHVDTNMHTVNIALNDDFTGGGLFYVKPPHDINPNMYPNEENDYFSNGEFDPTPDLYDFQYKYDYVNNLRHENTSDIVFPKLETGDALIHNFTVWHAVAPIETGTRYSMVLFFDMDNPCLVKNDDDYDDDDDEEEQFDVYLRHNARDCDPTTGKLVPGGDIDVYWVNPDQGAPMEIVELGMTHGQTVGMDTMEGHVFRAFRAEGEEPREVLASITTKAGQEDYDFESSFTTQEDCDALNSVDENEL